MYRGDGRPPARELGIEAADLRRREYVLPNDMPFGTDSEIYTIAAIFRGTLKSSWFCDYDGFESRLEEALQRGNIAHRDVQYRLCSCANEF